MLLFRFLFLICISAPLAAAPDFVQCYDFRCKTTQDINYDPDHWAAIDALFEQKALDMAQEKQAIRQAVALMERISGDISGTYRDKGGNYPGYDLPQQMDCIDESTNTFQYLHALERRNLLSWHRVDLKHRRVVWLFTHWTATIAEKQSERKFAVDSWHRDNGLLPILQPLADWRRKRDFPVAFNPELATQ